VARPGDRPGGGAPTAEAGQGSEDEDLALWRKVAAAAKPLKRRPAPPPRAETPPPTPTPATPSASKAQSKKTGTGSSPPAPPPSRAPELRPGETPGLDKRTAARLRRGQLPVEARIDLHGHTQRAAHAALNAFIEASWHAGRRCVLVITGKGRRAEGTEGVLRAAVPRWLNTTPNRDRLLAFTHAQPRDGGEGALYVYLKRRR